MAHASSSRSTRTPRPIPCQSCRERRVKCDYSVPNCSRCSASGTECTYKHLAGRRYVHRKRKPASEIQLHELEVATPGIQAAEGNGLLVGTSQIGIGDLGTMADLTTNCVSPGSSCASDLSGTTALLEARSELLTSILRMADDWGKWDAHVDENPHSASGEIQARTAAECGILPFIQIPSDALPQNAHIILTQIEDLLLFS